MNRRGVCYDVGRVMWGQDWRPEFSPEEARRELQIIRDDLHCNAVRICGQDLGRLIVAGEYALDCDLEVWLSPELWDHSPSETLRYIAEAAEAAEDLHRHRPGQVVLSAGSEATLFMNGIVEGSSVFEREHPDFWQRVRAGEHNGPLNAFLAEAAGRVREVFRGPVTYASVPLEAVEWSRFDFVSVDLYRGAELKDRFTDVLNRYADTGRPVAITEFGCCTYRGAADAGLPAPPPRHLEPAVPGPFRRLIGQAALPNPGVPGKQEQPPTPRSRVIEPGNQLSQLAVPPDQNRRRSRPILHPAPQLCPVTLPIVPV
jgi:hypothetical protein